MTNLQLESLSSRQITILNDMLKAAISSPTLNYREVCTIKERGLYIIFNDSEVVYVGKTTRSGKVRLTELASDFRSHTLNKKLLSEELKSLGYLFKTLTNNTKFELIEAGKITEEKFREHQGEINERIRTSLKFKFLPIESNEKLTSVEHYTISLLKPAYNDHLIL